MKLENCKTGMHVTVRGMKYKMDFVIVAVYTKTVCLYNEFRGLTVHFVRPKDLKKVK